MCVWSTYLIEVFREIREADVVDDVPGPDDEVDSVLTEQLEEVQVGLVSQELEGGVCKREKGEIF